MICSVEGCAAAKLKARGMCDKHYRRWLLAQPPVYGPLHCDCPEPVADPRVDAGMCQLCKRIPVALMHGRFAPKGTAA